MESLSNLIFGLALSIGALTLIGQQPSNFQQLLLSILYYAFSFFILITVWYSYTRTISLLTVETAWLIDLNVLLLFLVSIEPFLFNQMIHSSFSLVQNISIIYALDLGGLFVIQALFANCVLTNKTRPEKVLRSYRFRRDLQLVNAGLFFISAVPIFWSLSIPISGNTSIPVRFVFWIATVFIARVREIVGGRALSDSVTPT